LIAATGRDSSSLTGYGDGHFFQASRLAPRAAQVIDPPQLRRFHCARIWYRRSLHTNARPRRFLCDSFMNDLAQGGAPRPA
jgi:hypothetical protein